MTSFSPNFFDDYGTLRLKKLKSVTKQDKTTTTNTLDLEMTTRCLKIERNNTKTIYILYTKYNATKRKRDKNLLLGYGKYLYTRFSTLSTSFQKTNKKGEILCGSGCIL